MDLLKLIRSFEELLFEVLTWLIYYPRTLGLIARRPLRMIRYSNHELKDSEEEQYTDTLSPPLLLLITIGLMHLIELGMPQRDVLTGRAAQAIFQSDQNVVMLRSFLFGLLSLFAALAVVRNRRQPLERKLLRAPFYGQCYLAAVYALLVSLAGLAAKTGIPHAGPIGVAGLLAATIWYLVVQTMQFRQALTVSWGRAAGISARVYLEAVFAVIVIALILQS
ncbi:hypothetical protein [Allosphingosinicella indica]|uniref:Permease n=1 Tax=Allosphingosinicella indica TaxID=941907 RepID=A0A1X7FZY3_9SPHN|nr:hypothetical protein [Allosphingosinicella indica]SMF61690.1 hypothetical protein SAMN06295910_0682 [Allosphingosinicella indica]